jgi:hypothetical protein
MHLHRQSFDTAVIVELHGKGNPAPRVGSGARASIFSIERVWIAQRNGQSQDLGREAAHSFPTPVVPAGRAKTMPRALSSSPDPVHTFWSRFSWPQREPGNPGFGIIAIVTAPPPHCGKPGQ